ncbi:hypothetical protein K2X33_14215 [bacterium]|nr:hypothetical protein [bacterium]
MRSVLSFAGLFLLICDPLSAVPHSLAIPRLSTKDFRTEGLYEGGKRIPANIEAMRVSDHKGVERWVVDFSDALSRKLGKVAPQFQVRYQPGEKGIGATGESVFFRPAKFLLTFRGVRQNYLDAEKVKALVKKSRYVKDITLYPAIEDGDLVIELTLTDDVAFEAHQPVQKEGHLVLDLKPAVITQ